MFPLNFSLLLYKIKTFMRIFMTKKPLMIPVFFVIILLSVSLVGCSFPKASNNKIPSNSIVYANYSDGKYSLSFLKRDSFELIDKIELIKGWGEKFFKDDKGQLWFPIMNKNDMTTAENKVVIVDPVTTKIRKVTVGFTPRDIFFINDYAYVVCQEDGENPSIYRIDSNFKVSKWKTIEHGGLLSGIQSDGQNIFWTSLRTHSNPNLNYPLIVKVPINGPVEMKKLSEKRIGFNNLLYLNNKLYLGLENEKGTFVEFDAKTLKPLRYFPYHDMVGDIVAIGEQQIAITNFSKVMSKGSTITIINLKDGKILKSFNVKNLAERLSYVDGSLFVGDNYNMKLQKFNLNGESLNIFEIPTQTTNIFSME